jgi:Uma2 family endonuclease
MTLAASPTPPTPVKLTVHQYRRMIDMGIIPETPSTELIDGLIVLKDRSHAGDDCLTIGHEHAIVISRLAKLDRLFDGKGCFIRTQLPITLPPLNEPEPDGSIIIGMEDDFDRHPYAAETLCVIEVSDSSLAYDRRQKLRMYAEAGIGTYVIINLPDRQIEVFSNPLAKEAKYVTVEVLRTTDSLTLPVKTGAPVALLVSQLIR